MGRCGRFMGKTVFSRFFFILFNPDLQNSRISFNITLFITGAFALAAGGSKDWITLTALASAWSVGVGGNLPVDSAIFLGKA